ncbi:MAG: SdpI family protein [Opitutales bacterium]
MSLIQICGLCNVLFGCFCILLSAPLIGGRVGRNRFFGFRTRQALTSDEAWERINRYGAERRITWGLVIAFIGGLGIATDSPVIFDIARFAPLLAIIPSVQTVLFSRRLTNEASSAASMMLPRG